MVKALILIFSTFFISFFVIWIIIRFSHLHERVTADNDLHGKQKFHAKPVPRIGGVGVVLAMAGFAILFFLLEGKSAQSYFFLWVVSIPAFMIGFVEDITKRVSPMWRLIGVMVAAAMGIVLLNARLERLDILGVDILMQIAAVSVIFTLFAVAGVANAINIIDGYNGLAGGVTCLIFAGLAYAGWRVSDHLVTYTSISMICALIGFLIWNFPRGLIFLGDGGAYFVGFMIGELSVLLLARNPTISACYPLVLCSYPVFETLFSIYRKKYIRGRSPGQPDGVHMHMLIYKRFVRLHAYAKDTDAKTWRNSITSIYLWALAGSSVVPAMIFWDSPFVLWVLFAAFCLAYLRLYWAIVKFRHPDWMELTPDEPDARQSLQFQEKAK